MQKTYARTWRDGLREISTAQMAGRLDEAIDLSFEAITAFPKVLAVRAKYIQLLLKARRTDEATAAVQNWPDWPKLDARTAKLVALSLARGGQSAEVVKLYIKSASLLTEDAQSVCAVMDAYTALRDPEAALAVADIHRKRVGSVSAVVYERMSVLQAEIGDLETSNASALLALEKSPNSVRAGVQLSRNLMQAGSPKTALAYLEHVLEIAPHLVRVRVDAARAAKLSGQPKRAVELLLTLPEEELIRNRANERLLISTLIQTGEVDAAEARYQSMITRLLAQQAPTLVQALEAGPDKTVDLDARLDWAVELTGVLSAQDTAWVEAARWGCHADATLLDWLETRVDSVEEIMDLFVDMSAAEAKLEDYGGRGASLIVSAHIGALYAGPVAMELLGLDGVWLASSPNPPSAHYGRQLISTTDNNETQVARGVLSALRQDKAVVIALDGTSNPGAPRAAFGNKQVTYSNYAAKLSARYNVPAMFGAAVWTEDRKIDFHLAQMPTYKPGTSMNDYLSHWRDVYFQNVVAVINTAPENLRLMGGIWRDVR